MTAIKKSMSEVPAFGDEIARLRTQRKLSRSKLVKKLASTCAADDDDKDYSEAWLFRLENGEIKKIPRRIVMGLAEALHCTNRECARLLLLADKNILLDSTTKVTEIMEVFNYQMLTIYEDTCGFLSDLKGNQDLARLDDDELREVFLDALEMMIEVHRSQKPSRK